MSLLKKNKYKITGQVDYQSTVCKKLSVAANEDMVVIAFKGFTETFTHKEAKELKRLLTEALNVFETSYYNFD